MLKKALVAAAIGATLLGSIGTASADYIRRDGSIVRTTPHRVFYQNDRGHHRGWYKHHSRVRYDRWGHRY